MEYTFFAFDTDCIIHIQEEHEKEPIDALIAEIQSWHHIFNVFDKESEASRFNQASDIFVATPLFYTVTKEMMNYRNKTEKYFEPFVEVLMDSLRTKKEVSDEAMQIYKVVHDSGVIEFQDNETMRKSSSHIQINFHSFLKGYACDYMRDYMYERLNLRNFFIDFGGNLIAEGMQGDGAYWYAGIQHPQKARGETSHVLPLVNMSLVTTASYERPMSVNDELKSHIIDPMTGKFKDFKPYSVTIESERSAVAEVLSTALFVCSNEQQREFAQYFSVKVYIIEGEQIQIL